VSEPPKAVAFVRRAHLFVPPRPRLVRQSPSGLPCFRECLRQVRAFDLKLIDVSDRFCRICVAFFFFCWCVPRGPAISARPSETGTILLELIPLVPLHCSSMPILWPILLVYLLWIFKIDRAPEYGGRPKQWFRKAPLWRSVKLYFSPCWLQRLCDVYTDMSHFGHASRLFAGYYPVSHIRVRPDLDITRHKLTLTRFPFFAALGGETSSRSSVHLWLSSSRGHRHGSHRKVRRPPAPSLTDNVQTDAFVVLGRQLRYGG
jgi:hypothetical protein